MTWHKLPTDTREEKTREKVFVLPDIEHLEIEYCTNWIRKILQLS